MGKKPKADKLTRSWMHSFEEDEGDRVVLRPADYAFPPSRRGRMGMKLSKSGVAEMSAPGPTDRPVTGPPESWSQSGDRLKISGSSRLSGSYEVVSVDTRKLVLRAVSEADSEGDNMAKKKATKKKTTAKKRSTKRPRGGGARGGGGGGAVKPPTSRQCGTMQNHHRLMRVAPGYAEARRKCEEHAFRAAMSPMVARTGCTKIQVVVHVVFKSAAQNISDAQINSQMTVLNEDFRFKNADASTIPAPFAPLAADARIEFELATTDPDGNPTTGITRTRTSENSFGGDEVKSSATGGADPWPADRYLNIWVCQLGSGLLGYAQFPGGPPETDGVVITHTGFGTTGTAAAPFNLGRTATHEIGHYLNLRHIWGDDGDSCMGSDFVADTPNQAGPNGGVPTFPRVTCANGPSGDMFMNYMDYTDDAGMSMFSAGQVARMQAALDGPRSSLGDTIPCDGGTPPKDPVKDTPKDGMKEPIKDDPKDGVKEPIKDGPKDGPKDFFKDIIKDGPWDPGPKGFDPGPKFFDPGPKGWDGGGFPFGFRGGGGMPFVLATPAAGGTGGTPCGGCAGCRQMAAENQQLRAALAQLMAQYGQRGGY